MAHPNWRVLRFFRGVGEKPPTSYDFILTMDPDFSWIVAALNPSVFLAGLTGREHRHLGTEPLRARLQCGGPAGDTGHPFWIEGHMGHIAWTDLWVVKWFAQWSRHPRRMLLIDFLGIFFAPWSVESRRSAQPTLARFTRQSLTEEPQHVGPVNAWLGLSVSITDGLILQSKVPQAVGNGTNDVLCVQWYPSIAWFVLICCG